MNINFRFLRLTSNAVNNLVVIILFSKNVNSELNPVKSSVSLWNIISFFFSDCDGKQWKSKLEAKYVIKCYFLVIIGNLYLDFLFHFLIFIFMWKLFSQKRKVFQVCQCLVLFFIADKIVPITDASSNSWTSHGLVVGADIVHAVLFFIR